MKLFLVGVFVALFLGFFRPFGLSEYPYNHWPIVARFGLVTWVFGAAYYFFGRYVLKIRQDDPSWKFWKWIIYVIGLIVVIAIGNVLLVNYLFTFNSFGPGLFIQFLINTAAIGFFPVVLSGLLSIYRNEMYFQKQARTINTGGYKPESEPSSLELKIPGRSKDEFIVNADDVCYLEAEENYVAVIFRNSEKSYVRELIRNTFSRVDQYLPDDRFLRCHRSFIVNLDKIIEVKGNAQGLTLGIDGIEQLVPVSRTYIDTLRDRLISREIG